MYPGSVEGLPDELDQRVELGMGGLAGRPKELFGLPSGRDHLGYLEDGRVPPARLLLARDPVQVLDERGDPLGLEPLLGVVEVEQDQLVEERPEPADHRSGSRDLGSQGDEVLDR